MKIQTTSRTISYIYERQAQRREYGVFNSIPLLVKDFPSKDISLPSIIKTLEENVPKHLFSFVEAIYVGDFPGLNDRNAVFADGAIYVRHDEATNYDFLENIIHEIAHSLVPTELVQEAVFGDSAMKREFLGKRERLRHILKAEGYKIPEKYYTETKYVDSFDRFLSEVVGYPTLLTLTMGLFVTPYGATSLEEYFADGFEKFYLEDPDDVKTISPSVYELIKQLHLGENK